MTEAPDDEWRPATREQLADALQRVVDAFPTVGVIHTPTGDLDLDEIRELLGPFGGEGWR